MNPILALACTFAFLSIFIESINLVLQLKGKNLTKWLGKKAFYYHAVVVTSLWVLAFLFLILLQFEDHPQFHTNDFVKAIGLFMLMIGGLVASLGFYQLGLKRSLCLNFFEDNVSIVETKLYQYAKNPEDFGLWMAIIGFALVTSSIYNLMIAVEYIIIMIPHQWLENRPLAI